MKKLVFSYLVVAAMFFSAALVTGCNKDDPNCENCEQCDCEDCEQCNCEDCEQCNCEDCEVMYMVTFMNEGIKVNEFSVKDGSTLSKPVLAPREGYKFDGWHTDEDFNNVWDFVSETVNDNIILYAKWIAEDVSIFDGTITATVEDGNKYNSEVQMVKAEIWDDEADALEVIAAGSYSNGGFTLELPQTVKSSLLFDVQEWFDDVDGLNFSNSTAKITYFEDVTGYDSEESCGNFVYSKVNEEGIQVWSMFVFANSDVTITGSNSYLTCSITLKAGWNIVYVVENGETELTTNTVSGLKWYCTKDFEDYDWW